MRICIDLDGVICQLRKPDEQYADLKPIPGAVEKLRQLRAAGHYVIIATARHMKTCEGNVGRVVALLGGSTLAGLDCPFKIAHPLSRSFRARPVKPAAGLTQCLAASGQNAWTGNSHVAATTPRVIIPVLLGEVDGPACLRAKESYELAQHRRATFRRRSI